jgi:hypothetical protein
MKLLFIFISRISATAAAAVAETFEHADYRNAQEEAHQSSELGNELNSVLREIVDVLVLHGSHKELQDDRVRVASLHCLT